MTKMKRKCEERYAPVPTRAVTDSRLTATELRTLAVIAAHDQFQRNGQGCYASHTRLVEILNVHMTTLVKAIIRLIELGYVRGNKREGDRRFRVYTVLYTPDDEAAFSARLKQEYSDANGQSMVTNSPIDGFVQDVTNGNHSSTPPPIYSSKRPKYNKEIYPPEGDLQNEELDGQPVGSINKVSVIAEKVRDGAMDVGQGAHGLIGDLVKSKSISKARRKSEADQNIDAAIDESQGVQAPAPKPLMNLDAKPSSQLLNSSASRKARGV